MKDGAAFARRKMMKHFAVIDVETTGLSNGMRDNEGTIQPVVVTSIRLKQHRYRSVKEKG
jgi:hypothetical protein